jgi:uncharacterized protein (DUF2235 family)
MHRSLLPVHQGREQHAYYDSGVGTEFLNRVRGGAFGDGLDANIIDGYRWLVQRYRPGDEVYIFGFSRGAYTARSLVGLIRNCGLLVRALRDVDGAPVDLAEASPADIERTVQLAYDIYRSRKPDDHPNAAHAQRFREACAREIRVKCLGVWDTVGALGVPLRVFASLNRERYAFHDTKLSGIVDNAFHALAIDEHRPEFEATLWAPTSANSAGQRIEQVWFPGAHGDVGGGYDDDRRLATISLRWMQQRVASAGLGLDIQPALDPAEERIAIEATVHDSFRKFGRLYGLIRERHYRTMGRAQDGLQELHATLLARLRGAAAYRPRNTGLSTLLAAVDPDLARNVA